jgi:hypothetical protein
MGTQQEVVSEGIIRLLLNLPDDDDDWGIINRINLVALCRYCSYIEYNLETGSYVRTYMY